MSGDVYLFPSRELGHIKANTVYKIFQSVGYKLERSDIDNHTRKTLNWGIKKEHIICSLDTLYNMK